jgi:outer membrane protein OmpA-like peptidoglycan-associated protein
VAAILHAYPNATVRVEGYTDNVGTPAANLLLSQRRAVSVGQALISRGVQANRISTQGFGETNAVASNSTEAGRAQNRRTDLVVTGR